MTEGERNRQVRDLEFQLLGWILFIVCAICFIASGWKNQDILSFVGSIVFFIACIFFVIPLVGKYQQLKQLDHSDRSKATLLE